MKRKPTSFFSHFTLGIATSKSEDVRPLRRSSLGHSRMLLPALLWALVLLPPPSAHAQSALDGFDPGANGTIWAVAVQADGKILVGGSFTFLGGGGLGTIQRNSIGRLNANGAIDSSFNPGCNGTIKAIVVQPDGKILVAGTFTMLGGGSTGMSPRNNIGRLNPDGSLDNYFDPGASNTVLALALQPDGKILLGGQFTALGGGSAGPAPRRYVGRLNGDGSLDTGFNPGANNYVNTIAVEADGTILVGGSFSALGGISGTTTRRFLGRFNADGSLDPNFDPGANYIVWALAVQPNGKILVGGGFSTLGGGSTGVNERHMIGRLNPNGSVDADFDPGANSTVYAIAMQPGGKILLAGTFATLGGGGSGTTVRSFIGRLNGDGSLDPAFDPGADGIVYALALQGDGKILVGGWFAALGGGGAGKVARNRIGRLNADGTLDGNFNPGANGVISALALQADGKILVGGVFSMLGGGGRGNTPSNTIGRLNIDGSIDSSFTPGVNGIIRTIVVQPDGKILVGGDFSFFASVGGGTDSTPFNYLCRLNPEGTLDSSFNPGANARVSVIALQADGKILVGGDFTTLGGGGTGTASRGRIGRLNVDGSLDSGFNPDANGSVHALSVQPDGKILVGGDFTTLGGGGTGATIRNKIGRLNADGSLDITFDPGANGWIQALALQPDGKILVAGEFSTLGGGGSGIATRNRIGRLNVDGSLDSSFNPGADNVIFTLALQTDGRILLGGDFSALGGGGTGTTTRNKIGRLNADGSLDASFDPGANGYISAIALQADGKVLVAGGFSTLGSGGLGTIPLSCIGRLTNTDAALQNLAVDPSGSKITWKRSGSSPEVDRVTFEFSIDGTNYTLLGNGVRISGGWQLTGLGLPMGQLNIIRARGIYSSGYFNGSGSIAESLIDATAFTGIFAQIAAGGTYQTVLTGINTSQSNADVWVSLRKSNGTPFDTSAGIASEPQYFNLQPMGTIRLLATLPGDTVAGYALLSSSNQVDGTALFKTLKGGLVLSEAGVGLSKSTRNFTAYIDNTNNAMSGYAVVNTSSTTANLNLTLRDNSGSIRNHASISLLPRQHIPEFAYQRFLSTATAGFEGSIDFSSDQNVAAVALRYDNVNLDTLSQVFSTIPVLVDEASTILYFPQVADGAGYRTNFILLNPQETSVDIRLDFYDDNGEFLELPIGGTLQKGYNLTLSARGVARLFTEGSSAGLSKGWVKVSSRLPILGSSIFQTRAGDRILSEAGVASSALTAHFTTYVESLGSTWSGLAICNPNVTAVNLTMNLRRPNGEIFKTTSLSLPAKGHDARFFTDWFPEALEFEGTLEVIASQQVSAVALRYDNPQHDVFATLPVIILR